MRKLFTLFIFYDSILGMQKKITHIFNIVVETNVLIIYSYCISSNMLIKVKAFSAAFSNTMLKHSCLFPSCKHQGNVI